LVLVTSLGSTACQTRPRADAAEAAKASQLSHIAREEQQRAPAAAFSPFLASTDAIIRARAATALGRLEHRGAVPLLLPLADDPSPAVREQVAWSLGQTDLALTPNVAGHDETRAQVELALVTRLAQEQQPSVRRSVVRALGRVATGPGLDALLNTLMAGTLMAGRDREEVLLALGVSGARRQASLRSEQRLAAAVDKALTEGPDALRSAAAYAAFRQKLFLSMTTVESAMAGPVQARIFAARAATTQPEEVRARLVALGLSDKDWRVQVEAARAAEPRDMAHLAQALDAAVEKLVVKKQGAFAHVVRGLCASIAALELPPAQRTPPIARALSTLLSAPAHRTSVGCACAVAKDAIEGDSDDVSACASGTDGAALGRLNVALLATRNSSSKEKAAQLATFLAENERKVRVAAAQALLEAATPAAAEVAVARLAVERDVGVISALMELVALDENQSQLTNALMALVTEQLFAGTSFEDVEPLLTIARVARARRPEENSALLERLARHPHPAVRDAATGVAQGDRPFGPRAKPIAPPAVGDLPQYALLKTSRGNIRLAFSREQAPSTVANFVELARAGVFNGTSFHRVIADFVAQGGDPRGDGSGGPGYTIACERSDQSFLRGAVGMAHAGLDTGGSQFFLTISDQPHLDGRYTLFANVVSGVDVMDAIQPDDRLLQVEITFAAPPLSQSESP
jgi:cyclophilin family peptidyl-prolyl cis-trans isomerase/HEAT repeat protein